MNKDQMKGTIDDVAGRARRQVGEWTGDTNAQLGGLGQQVKGKAEKAWGNAKEAVQEGHQHLKEQAGRAWSNTKDAAHDGKGQVKSQAKKAWEMADDAVRDGKQEARRRQEAEQMHEGGDLDPVYQCGPAQGARGHGVLVTEKPRCV